MATLTTGAPNMHRALYDQNTGYIINIEDIRLQEHPLLSDTTYLDHAGTALYPKSLIEAFSAELIGNTFGNPHSASASSQLSTRRIEDVRLQVLRFFNASPDHFDVVFSANATAAIKLVGELFRDTDSGFRYLYHVESHTSLVGVRELALQGSECFSGAEDLSEALQHFSSSERCGSGYPLLVAYPGQSNMTGRQFSFEWAAEIHQARESRSAPMYTLYDAAAVASTSSVDLSNLQCAPDFTAVSFYKIFGFPDLGALIIRKDCSHLVDHRKYFGGGTADAIIACKEKWHARKKDSLHSRLEDGTLPFHNIVALGLAFEVFAAIFGRMGNVSRHIQHVAKICQSQLAGLRHASGKPVCRIYGNPNHEARSGPVIAFNVHDPEGNVVSNTEFEKLAIVNNIQLRTGGLCNPGGIATHLELSAADIKSHHASGYRCGGENDIINGMPLGAIRVSFGATSSLRDVNRFIEFMKEYFVELMPTSDRVGPEQRSVPIKFVVESLAVFPIKSCAAFRIPLDVAWEVGPRGLAWDREWCLVHEGTRAALSQKRYPRMALLCPSIDLEQNALCVEHDINGSGVKKLTLSLSHDENVRTTEDACETTTARSSNVCGEALQVEHYTSISVSRYFSDALGVPCTLARFPPGMVRQAQVRQLRPPTRQQDTAPGRGISLSNESPILLVSRSSVNRVNEQIKANGGQGRAVSADSFRGNIVISEQLEGGQVETPFAEDEWTQLSIGERLGPKFEVLGPCQRCQMVCVDQTSACRGQEPFSTLSKTRRRDGRVWFGVHLCLMHNEQTGQVKKYIKVGERGDGILRWSNMIIAVQVATAKVERASDKAMWND